MLSAERRSGLLLLGLCVATSSSTRAAELTKRTAEAFQRYTKCTEAHMQSELADPQHFLYFDSLPEKQKRSMLARLQSGQIVVEPMHTCDHGEQIEVPDGLVHHWLAIGFVPGATRDQAVALAQDYARHVQIYAPDVQRAQVLSHVNQHYSVDFRLYRQAIVTVVYNTEFSVDYFLPDRLRASCFARAVRIAEVQNAGKADEKELGPENNRGYLWALNLYTRYMERDNGVYIQIEFLALSRTVPRIFAWLVGPYIRSIPRDYLTHYVLATRKALSPAARPS
jgi:hypothetical protein